MAAGYPRFPVDGHDEAEVPDLQHGTITRVAKVENGDGLDNGNLIFLAHVSHGNLVFGPMPEECVVKRAPRADPYGKQNWNEVFTLMEIQQEGLAGVVLPLAVFKDADYLYIVMPWCRRGDLFKRLVVDEVALDERALREWTIKLLRPLAELHQSGWAHGDLAMENFLVADDDTPAITDCAQAMQVHAPGAPQNEAPIPRSFRTGRDQFRPPETVTRPAGATRSAKKGDVYQLGFIIFALFTKAYPFTPGEVCVPRRELPTTGGCEASVRRLLGYRPSASPALQDFLGRLLAPDPNRRLSAKEALAHPWI